MPDWEDKVDPSFDFQADMYTPNRDVSADIYAHEVFEASPYDGVLISRAVAQRSQTKYETLLEQGARRYLRLPPGLEVFGDCGAFSYVNEDEPWYKTADVLDYYAAVQVDYGASVDHLVVDTIYEISTVEEKLEDGSVVVKKKKQKKQMPEAERKRRIQLTLENAQDFLVLHRKKGYRFTPVGVAQGWSPDTYADSVRHLLKMGYRYIALGGLARSSASTVLNVLIAANQAVEECSHSDHVRFHLFGVAKLTLIAKLPGYRVASIDSASYLRKAWLRSGQNYLGTDKQWYTAIRVPQSSHHRVRKYIEENGKSIEDVREQEHSILQSLQQYSDCGLSPAEVEELLDAIVEYDTYMLRLGDDGQSLRNETVSREKYRRTLQARPWEQCQCKVCQDLKIHALIFRGTNRNKRRGFHNTWTFYHRLGTAD
jgi:hypothetical protein